MQKKLEKLKFSARKNIFYKVLLIKKSKLNTLLIINSQFVQSFFYFLILFPLSTLPPGYNHQTDQKTNMVHTPEYDSLIASLRFRVMDCHMGFEVIAIELRR